MPDLLLGLAASNSGNIANTLQYFVERVLHISPCNWKGTNFHELINYIYQETANGMKLEELACREVDKLTSHSYNAQTSK